MAKKKFMRKSRASGSELQRVERILRQQCREQQVLRGATGAIAAFNQSAARNRFEQDSGLDLI